MMRTKLLSAAAIVASVLIAAPASAQITPGSSISTNGSVTGSGGADISGATSLAFGGVSAYGQGTGTFAGFSCGAPVVSCGSIQNLSSLVVGPDAISNFVVLSGGNNVWPITFDLSAITDIQRLMVGGVPTLAFTGDGTLHYGADSAAGTVSFTAQGNNITSFSESTFAASVPEPATWAMMLFGFGAIGMSMRSRRRRPVLAQVA